MTSEVKQLPLPLSFSRDVAPKVLVSLCDADRACRQHCIDKEIDFPQSLLVETRAQRIGCSVRELSCMRNYELSRELADEAVVMRSSAWQTMRAAWINWETINARAKEMSRELAIDFAEFREAKKSGLLEKVLRPEESGRKRRVRM